MENQKEGRFVPVAKWEDLDPEEGLMVEVEDTQVALFLLGDTVHAIEDKCPHRAGPLSEGEIVGEEVRCPWHGARFNIRTGKVLCAPARRDLKTYPVKVEEGQVYLSLQAIGET